MKRKQSSFKMRRELWSVLITFLQLMSSTSSNFLSVSQHGPRVLIGKLTILSRTVFNKQ